MREGVLSVLVVDDEKLARRDLKFLLKSIENISIAGEAKNGVEALERIERLSPDLTLLDIEMPGLNGLQVVEKLLAKGLETAVVFVTAYDHYAVRAFEVNAVDYLLKPVAAERLEKAIRRVRKRREGGVDSMQSLKGLLSAMKSHRSRKLSLRLGDSHRIIGEEELILAFIERGVITAVTKECQGTLACQSLEELQELLSEDRFTRVHRRFIVNIDMISEVIPWFSGTYRLKLKNGTMVPLSRNRVRSLRQIIRF